MAGHIAIFLLRVYRATLSPVLGALAQGMGLGGCRYTPTCSQYAIESIQRHGVLWGLVLTARRLGRCHPWGGYGYDPVPADPPARHAHSDHHLGMAHSPSRQTSSL